MGQTVMHFEHRMHGCIFRLFDMDSGKTGNLKGDAGGANFEVKPLSYHMHMRWDIVPRWKIRPFLTFGSFKY